MASNHSDFSSLNEQLSKEFENVRLRPHIAVSIYSTVGINNETGTVENHFLHVIRRPDKSLCASSCSINSNCQGPGNTCIFVLDPKLRNEGEGVTLTAEELSALRQGDGSEHEQSAKDKLCNEVHIPGLQGAFSAVPAPSYRESNSEESNGGCVSNLPRHYVTLISLTHGRPDDDRQLAIDTLSSMGSRRYSVRRTTRPGLIDESKTAVRIQDDYRESLPLDFERRIRGTPTAYTRHRQPNTDLSWGNMWELHKDSYFLQGIKDLLASDANTSH